MNGPQSAIWVCFLAPRTHVLLHLWYGIRSAKGYFYGSRISAFFDKIYSLNFNCDRKFKFTLVCQIFEFDTEDSYISFDYWYHFTEN